MSLDLYSFLIKSLRILKRSSRDHVLIDVLFISYRIIGKSEKEFPRDLEGISLVRASSLGLGGEVFRLMVRANIRAGEGKDMFPQEFPRALSY